MRTLATLLAVLMVLVDLPVRAAVTPEEDKIEQLYQRGQAKYEEEEWDAAAVLWAEALNLMEEDEESSGNRSMLASNALDAYMEAFRDTREPRFLKSAIALVDQYIESLNGREPSQAVQDAANRIRETYARVVEESEGNAGTGSSGASSTGGSSGLGGENSRSTGAEGTDNLRSDRGRKTALGLIISGSLTGVFGLGASSLIAIGAINAIDATSESDRARENGDKDAHEQAKQRGEDADTLVITGAVVAPVLVIVGATMLGIGLAERRRNLAIAPLWNREMVGLSLSGRF